jgi:hypothetical protein
MRLEVPYEYVQCMLRLVADNEIPPEPDTDLEFLADSEPDPNAGLRTLEHEKTKPQGRVS